LHYFPKISDIHLTRLVTVGRLKLATGTKGRGKSHALRVRFVLAAFDTYAPQAALVLLREANIFSVVAFVALVSFVPGEVCHLSMRGAELQTCSALQAVEAHSLCYQDIIPMKTQIQANARLKCSVQGGSSVSKV
jgi:hypothetical protein